ncbi:RloB domain-containing protein [Parabacteroides sp. ZJ-118]|uniref:RloB domain-containing protein n=1 Tax=Parabacteroides sp. ZJ-118 TaxID=2709398 RepID=UPI0013ED8D7B|nr:RloB domain-containing protein [Parabacteroides sp. ZJ-118]
MDRKLTYKKLPGIRVLADEQAKKKSSPQDTETAPDSYMQIPSAYKKEDGTLSYSLVCVISGGTERERTFLNELERKHTFKTVDVIFVSTKEGEGGLTPKMMLSAFEGIYQNGTIHTSGRSVKLDSVDVIYMFTDVDHYENELKEILGNSEKGSPIWIISNPNFEIWLYYCYRNNPYGDLKEVLEETPSQRSSKLKMVNGTFNNGGGLDTRKAFEHLKEGIAHSIEHYQETNGIPNILSTQMHIFAKDVLLRLGDEYKSFVQKKQEFRERMKNNKRM